MARVISGWKSVADYMKVCVRTLIRWNKARPLPVKKIGGIVVTSQEKLDKWIDQGDDYERKNR